LFAGCLGAAATLESRTALKVGWWTIGVGSVLLFSSFTFMGLHTWTGGTGFTITQVVFCSGVSLLIIGAMRVGWTKLRSSAR
jgi:hypothetical protein